MMNRLIKRILRKDDGATIVEFGLVAPTLLFMLMGLFELGHGMYVKSIVNGVMQDAGRDATLEGASQNDLKALLKSRVEEVSPGSRVTLSWHSFGSYTEIGALEDYTDTNGDGKCSKDEPFEDLNENGVHDYYDGDQGIGDARDAIIFRTVVEYDRLFPMPGLGGWSDTNTVEGVTVLRNQPYRTNDKKPSIGKCTGTEDYSGQECSATVAGIGLACSNNSSSGGNPYNDNAAPGVCHTTTADGYHCH